MADFENIKAGLSAERSFTVDERLTVSHLKRPVLGTPMMIGLMEIVCMDMVQPLLPPGYTTVGYEVHVKHKAVALLGAQLKVWGKVLEAEGRKLLCEVRVTEGAKTIGEGLHRRTIVPVFG
ncbi:MAG TPA: thioesterase [Acidobacteriota bacterium]|nr:thioesterase [Acidobacteriota bacterium]